jgi:CBS domain-containing protein
VAPGDARDAVPDGEHRVQCRGGEADQALDPSPAGQLSRAPVSHRGAIVDSLAVLVRDVMTESVVTAEPARSLRGVARLMRERNVGSVVLVDGARPVAFITDRDVALCVVADERDASEAAGGHASTPVITALPDMDVEEAAERMIRHGVRRLVVVEAGALVGVVTLDDLTAQVGERAAELARRITRVARPAPARVAT